MRRYTCASHSVAGEHEAALLDELRQVLGLDDEQVEKVHDIVARNQRVVQFHWEQLRPEVQDAMRRAHRDIAELLRPEQRERLHHRLTLQREHHEGQNDDRPRPASEEEPTSR